MYAAQHAVATQTKAAQTDLAGALSGGKAEKSGVVRLRGAPFDVSRKEVADFFADFGVDERDFAAIGGCDGFILKAKVRTK